jgi:hypothetical protein
VLAGFARATLARCARSTARGKEIASATIAAATAAGRPRARGIRALREEKRIAPALIAERRSRVSGAGWDGGQARIGCQDGGETERVRARV